MKRITVCLWCVVCWMLGLLPAEEQKQRIVIIKADDIKAPTENWDLSFKISKEKGVKVSAGIICDSLKDDKNNYRAWLKKLHVAGDVEFWNHGWDHKRWDENSGKTRYEFSGSGFAHQKQHFEDSQALMKEVFGISPIAFGAPYNKMDKDTMKVLGENADVLLCFDYSRGSGLPDGKISAVMSLRGEHDGTGKPNFEQFKTEYEKQKVSFSALQFHPNSFTEQRFTAYGQILDLLIRDKWIFMLPREYVKLVKSQNK